MIITNLHVVQVDSENITFNNGMRLTSLHQSDCCENHYLSMSDLTLSDFEGLEFNLSQDNFFKKIEDYGIELIPIVGHSVKIPGYGYNNGYYSTSLDLAIMEGDNVIKHFDITECQVISD